MKMLRIFVLTYTIFTLIMFMFAPQEVGISYDETPDITFTLGGIINFVVIIGSFIINVLVYTTNYVVVNILLWAIRLLALLDLVIYIKRLINPLAN